MLRWTNDCSQTTIKAIFGKSRSIRLFRRSRRYRRGRSVISFAARACRSLLASEATFAVDSPSYRLSTLGSCEVWQWSKWRGHGWICCARCGVDWGYWGGAWCADLLEIEGDAAVAPAILLVAAAPATSLVVDAGEHCERRVCGLCER